MSNQQQAEDRCMPCGACIAKEPDESAHTWGDDCLLEPMDYVEKAESLQKQLQEISTVLGNPKGCLVAALNRRLASADRKQIADFLRVAFGLKPGGDPGWNTWQDILARYVDQIEAGTLPLPPKAGQW